MTTQAAGLLTKDEKLNMHKTAAKRLRLNEVHAAKCTEIRVFLSGPGPELFTSIRFFLTFAP